MECQVASKNKHFMERVTLVLLTCTMTFSQVTASEPGIVRFQQLFDPTDEDLGKLVEQVPRLKIVELSGSELLTARGIDHLQQIDGLQMLIIGRRTTPLTDEICHSISQLKELKSLQLSLPIQSPQQAQILASNHSITALEFVGPNINNKTIENSLPLIQNLKTLNLTATRCEDRTCLMLSEKSKLVSLNISGISARISNVGLKHISQMNQLEELQLIGHFDDQSLSAICDLERLKTLELQGDHLTADCLEPIGKLESLEYLSIWGVPITDESLRFLASTANLRSLSLNKNLITGSGLIHLKHLSQLEGLTLKYTPFETQYAHHLKEIDTLRHLNINSREWDQHSPQTYEVIGTLDQLKQLEGLCWDGKAEEMRKLHEQLPHLHLSNSDVSISYLPVDNTESP
ncbi:hypothetical protein [Rubinisphaera sp.]|uniref:hypothetical protein n=1 Tax=Rubinisphaera sp. TaxID=2024857 RepID=UPI000C101F62|nr:hypothetical protein [Rubinisphaera sp.]MBV07655.1 hypothetical protein [Rubinisphaera sp.]HCS53711.1 hypothetical protein [Planctomycetaceae bacterium]|tara:strand:+ start:121 stop:1329 length:1209 start_codon:yes stop_codon:yes gene_type:complete